MHALIRTERDPELRVKIVESTRDFADDPISFREKYVEDNNEFATQIIEAQKCLKEVKTNPEIARKISQVLPFTIHVKHLRRASEEINFFHLFSSFFMFTSKPFCRRSAAS